MADETKSLKIAIRKSRTYRRSFPCLVGTVSFGNAQTRRERSRPGCPAGEPTRPGPS